MKGWTGLLVACAACATSAFADDRAVIDLAGVQVRNATNQSRSSSPDTIDPSCRYTYTIDGMVRGRGSFSLLSILFPNPVPLAQAMETLSPGSSESLSGVVENPSGAVHPTTLLSQTLSGQQVVLGTTVTFAATLTLSIDASNIASFSFTNVTITPSTTVGYLEFVSGSATIVGAPPCAADFDNDCFVDFFDLDAYTECFEGGACPPGKSADFDGDGFVDFFDFNAFVVAFEAGC